MPPSPTLTWDWATSPFSYNSLRDNKKFQMGSQMYLNTDYDSRAQRMDGDDDDNDDHK